MILVRTVQVTATLTLSRTVSKFSPTMAFHTSSKIYSIEAPTLEI